MKLSKNSTIKLSKDSDSLSKIRVVLDWDEPDVSRNLGRFDLDASCFGLVPSELASGFELFDEEYFIFYGENNQRTDNGSIIHSGDDKTGASGETITVDLLKIPSAIVNITFFVTIHKAFKRQQNFGQVSNASISLFDDVEGTLIAEYKLNETFTNETAVQFGTLYKSADGWEFKAIGQGYHSELADILYTYGVEVG